MNNPFNLANFYSFNTLATALLPSSFNNVEVLAIVTFDVASAIANVNLSALAANIYPLLPSGINPNPNTYQYIVAKSANGSKTVLALEWIDLNSVVLSAGGILNVSINNATIGDTKTVYEALLQLGYTSVKTNFVTGSSPTLTQIIITPTTKTITHGTSSNFVAIGVYSDNSVVNISQMVNWILSSSTGSTLPIAIINNTTGAISAVNIGSCTITASLQGVTSSAVTLTVN